MAFQIKDFRSIAASMINWMKATQNKLTDFNEGSVARTLVEAPAAEIDELYQQMFVGLKEAIPVSVYNSFSFDAVTSLPATGLIRVSVTASDAQTTIPAGTEFALPFGDTTYLSSGDVVIAPGRTFIDVLVTCSTPGVAGNILAGQVFTAEPTIVGFQGATNLSAFVSGVDTETDEDRKNRFNAFIASLPRGTIAAITYGLNQVFLTDASGNKTERVVTSSIVEPWLTDEAQPIALVQCYIHNGSGGTSSALLSRAREVIYGYREENGTAVPGWKAAGVKVDLFVAAEETVDVAGTVVVLDGYAKDEIITQARQAIFTYIQSLAIGASVIKSELIAIVMGIDGVFNITLSQPATDRTVDQKTKLMPGAIALT